jgi:hypothetical protein
MALAAERRIIRQAFYSVVAPLSCILEITYPWDSAQPRGGALPRRGEAGEALKLLISARFTAAVNLSFVKLPEPKDLGQLHSFF